jgi:hypothetical protein
MELRINIIRLAIFAILIITILIGVFVLKHQNKVIRQLNEVLRQEQVDDSIQRTTDSIKYKQLQLRVFSDSMALAKFYRDRELELIKKLTKKKIDKYENVLKFLPDSPDAVRDSIWNSELTRPEGIIK